MGTSPSEWHAGEEQMHRLLHVPHNGNPTSPGLSAHSMRLLHKSSLIAIGTLDDHGLPWTTVLAGEPGFARSLGQSIVGVKALVGPKFDPVLGSLLGRTENATIHAQEKSGKTFSALGIHLATRDRVKLWGKMIAGALTTQDSDNEKTEAQMIFAIQASLGSYPLCCHYNFQSLSRGR